MSRRHVMIEVEEKGLNHELPHSELHHGRLVASVTSDDAEKPATEPAQVEPTPEPQPAQEQAPKRGRRGRQAAIEGSGDPAVG